MFGQLNLNRLVTTGRARTLQTTSSNVLDLIIVEIAAARYCSSLRQNQTDS